MLKILFRRSLSLLLVLLTLFTLPFASAAGKDETPLALLAEKLQTLTAEIAETEALLAEANDSVAALEAEYATATGSRLVTVQDELLDAMITQEDCTAILTVLYNQQLDLYDELADLIESADCTIHTLETRGYDSRLTIIVTVDDQGLIYDLTVQVDGDERDQAVGEAPFTVQFMGKQLPLDAKRDGIELISSARVTSEAVIEALNTLADGAAPADETPQGPIIDPQGIADYIFRYGRLPDNFITKKEAQALGWDSSRNYVSDVAPGYSIGGDRFGNYEGLLPTKKGRQWYEADCYYTEGRRNAYRILYSNDGLVYYTDDHYESFTQMFPSWE